MVCYTNVCLSIGEWNKEQHAAASARKHSLFGQFPSPEFLSHCHATPDQVNWVSELRIECTYSKPNPLKLCIHFPFTHSPLLMHTLWMTTCLPATTFHYFSVTWIVSHSGWAAFITMYWFQITWYVLHLQKLASHWPDLLCVAIIIF